MDRSTRTFSDLRHLVFGEHALSRAEVRYMKNLLSGVHVDLIGELPLELIVFIALNLQLKDFARCLCVSKVWRQLFLSEPVMVSYARLMWPAMIDGEVDQCKFLDILSKIGWASSRFRGTAGPDDIELVRWDYKAHYKLDPELHGPDDHLPNSYAEFTTSPYYRSLPTAFYAHGKVAWNVHYCVVIVDDLRSKTRKVFTPPNGVMLGYELKLQAFGSRFVVATVDRFVVAWDHVDNRPFVRPMPCPTLRCATRDDKVAVVLYGGDIIIWKPGQEIFQMDTAQLILEAGMDSTAARVWKTCLNVFFDPRNSNTLYLASGYFSLNSPDTPNSNRVVHFTIHEISEAGHIATFSASYDDPNKKSSNHRPSHHPDEDIPELVVTSEYEYEHSFIVFAQRTQSRFATTEPIAGFDLLKRKFVRFDPDNPDDDWRAEEGAFAFSTGHDFYTPFNFHVRGGFDLDFLVDFEDNSHYSVIRPRLTPNTEDSNLQEAG